MWHLERIVSIRRTRLNRTRTVWTFRFHISSMSVYKARFGEKPAILLWALIVPASDMGELVWDGGSISYFDN